MCLWDFFDHSSRRAFVRSGTDVGREGLSHSHCFNSSQRCSIELSLGLRWVHHTRSSMSLWTLLWPLVHKWLSVKF